MVLNNFHLFWLFIKAYLHWVISPQKSLLWYPTVKGGGVAPYPGKWSSATYIHDTMWGIH